MNDSDIVIRVEGLGKKYSLHHEQSERYTALRDVVARQARAAGRLLNPFSLAGQLRKAQRQASREHAASEEEFWALKDVSFEIRRGERVGIIGRNGAGKSTLLKILSRITEPTTGRVDIRGRVASLLEVGTGFHPELTGRENIFLNGAILGMTRQEIRSKFDEIVVFAEVEKFLDTPVKRYSSGMYVRLAFSVAAHLEPDILVVDEVLSVGDSQFQDKCIAAMKDHGQSERSLLFISHNIGAIGQLCNTGIYLDQGRTHTMGAIETVIAKYLNSGQISFSHSYSEERSLEEVHIKSVTIIQGENQSRFECSRELFIVIEIAGTDPVIANAAIHFKRVDGLCICDTSDEIAGESIKTHRTRTCVLPPYSLNEGTYVLDIYLGDRNKSLYQSILGKIKFKMHFNGYLAVRSQAKDWAGMTGPGMASWS